MNYVLFFVHIQRMNLKQPFYIIKGKIDSSLLHKQSFCGATITTCFIAWHKMKYAEKYFLMEWNSLNKTFLKNKKKLLCVIFAHIVRIWIKNSLILIKDSNWAKICNLLQMLIFI